MLLVIGFNIGLSVLPITPKVSAADSHKYTLTFKPEDVEKLRDAANDGGIGNDDLNGVLKDLGLVTTGGRLGTQAFKIDSDNSDKHDMPIFGLDYYCTPNTSVDIDSETLDVKKNPLQYTITTAKPSDDKTYALIHMRVGIGDNGDWKAVASKDAAVDTYVGADAKKAGTLHYGSKPSTATTPAEKSQEFDAVIRDKFQGMGESATVSGGSGHTIGPNFTSMYNQCMPQPSGHLGKATSIYNNLSDDDKSTWKSVISDGGLGDDPTAIGSGGSGSDGDGDLTCESSGALSWILCGVFNDVKDASDYLLTHIIQPELKTDPICLDASGKTCEDGSNVMYKAWSNFRIYGNVFLVIALLVMIFGQTIGGGIVDAYTVKKVLPRLLIAVVLINLSIYIVALLVDITNILGGALGAALTAPLDGGGAFTIHPSGIQAGATIGVGGGLIATALGAGVIGALFSTAGASLILVVLVLPALFAFIAILVTIILRKALILGLVLVSPLAFAMYCLPNTEKYFKKWWDLLFEMLMIYPIIIVIFAIADVLSAITGGVGNSTNSPLNAILSFALLIIPLFMIPYSFKLAGNSLARLHGAAAGVSGKVGEMNKSRADRARGNFARKRLDRKSAITNGINSQIFDPDRGGTRGKIAKGLQRTPAGYALRRAGQAANHNIEQDVADLSKDPRTLGIKDDGTALRAANMGSSYLDAVDKVSKFLAAPVEEGGRGMDKAEALEEAKRGAAAVQRTIGFGRSQAVWSTHAMTATGTEFIDQRDVNRSIANASGGNISSLTAMSGYINSATKQTRPELAQGFSTMRQASIEALRNNGEVSQETLQKGQVAASRGMDAISQLRAKPQDVTNLSAGLGQQLARSRAIIVDGVSSPAAKMQALEQAKVTIGQIKQLDAQKGYGSIEVQGIVTQLATNTNSHAADVQAYIDSMPAEDRAYHDADLRRRGETMGTRTGSGAPGDPMAGPPPAPSE